MSIIDDLRNDEIWDSFLAKKRSKAWDYADILQMQSFILNRRYRPIVEAIANETYVFKDPYMIEVPKDNGTYRQVFNIRRRDDVSEIVVLQVISQLLKRYEKGFCSNLFSLPENGSVEGVMNGFSGIDDFEKKYLFKFDVTNYANSIDINKLIPMVDELIDECDRPIKKVIFDILRNPNVIVWKNGAETSRVVEQKGAMTGLPFVHFLSALYLNDMDWHFHDLGKPYFRFNDDVAIVCDSMEDALEQKKYVVDHIAAMGLVSNEDKMQIVEPGQVSAYLGIKIDGKKLSLINKTIYRYRDKMQIRAKKIRKRINSGEISVEHGFVLMIHYVMNIQYGTVDGGFCFMNTYFPRITSCDGLSQIDHYAQHYIRYVYTGKFSKTNARRVPYDMIRSHGYLPLVSAYRMFRRG